MKCAVITDTNVSRLYDPPDCFVVPAGESSKSLQTIESLASELSRRGYGRDTTIVALGGGMITDLAGFLAGTFCRGVPLILIPTTLLAMVDAAIGGKTAVNLPQGKNLIGSTTFPEKVIVHLPFLSTLPDIEWENGLIEVLKIGLLFDPHLFFHLYPTRSQIWNLDRAKAPGFDDRKRVHISNIDPFTIVESRELSRESKSKFVTESGIHYPLK